MSKTPKEKETRENLLGWARKLGVETDFLKLLARYDDLLRGAKSSEDKKAIQIMGIKDMSSFFSKAQITTMQFKDGSTAYLNDKNDIIITRGSRKKD